MAEALTNGWDIKIIAARVLQAEAAARIARSQYFPTVSPKILVNNIGRNCHDIGHAIHVPPRLPGCRDSHCEILMTNSIRPRINLKLRTRALCVLASLLCSCAATSVKETWKAPDVHRPAGKIASSPSMIASCSARVLRIVWLGS